ncbi:hypothetical protein CQY23_04525 [Mycobacterium celatum]|uniref:Fido domain-containing protein n=1 Tax=Mycobacterium celatum TaxID=28045 RepID=A0A2G5PQE8_MYCCE|nr:hypothetical protein CQY23_04525 [Mycobacterium celatum]
MPFTVGIPEWPHNFTILVGLTITRRTAAHSLARNHALVDGNKRAAWTACRTFLVINGHWMSAPEDERLAMWVQSMPLRLANISN